MKYFAVFAAVCACVLAGTLDPPPIEWCSFGVGVNVFRDGEDAGSFSLLAMKKGDTVVASRWDDYGVGDIIRGDLMDSSKKIPVIHGEFSDPKRDSESCSVKYVTQDEAKKYMNKIAPGMLYPFEYKTKEDFEGGGIELDKYCNDDNECLFVKKVCDVNCLYAHSYEVEDGGEKVIYGESYSFFSLSEMHAFYLEEDGYPGCGEGSPAYTEPENICLDKYTPEQPYCAYSVESFLTYGDDPTPDDVITLYIMMKDDVIVGAYEADDEKGIIREDLMSPNSTTVAVAYGDTDSSPKCETISASIGEVEDMLSEYAGPILFPFTYEGEPEDDELDGTKCDKYCMDYYNGAETCLYVKKDCKKGCVVGASFSRGSPLQRGRAPFGRRSHPSKRGEVLFMHFKDYKELKDMSVFTLDKEKYPGCDEDSYAYKAPEKICGSKSAGSVVKSVAVVVVAAVLAALF